MGLFSDIKSDSDEGVHHEVGAIIVSLKRRSKVLGVTVSEKAHLAGVKVNCLNDKKFPECSSTKYEGENYYIYLLG